MFKNKIISDIIIMVFCMNILNICSNGDVLSIIRIVKIVINIIKIIIPIMLIISLMMDFTAAVKGDIDSLNKSFKRAIPKIVAAILIFFIPSLVHIVVNITSSDDGGYIKCLDDATLDGIKAAYKQQALIYIDNTKKSLSNSDYQIALTAINKIKDSNTKNELLNELNSIKEYININESINSSITFNDYNKLNEQISKIKDEEVKNKLSEKLEKYKKENNISEPINVSAGMTKKSYGNMEYYEIIPPHPTTNLPLIVYLHGDGQSSYFSSTTSLPIVKFINDNNAYDTSEFIFIAPKGNYQDWISQDVVTRLKNLIDHIVSEYSINKDKIIIMGASRGAIGTWNMVNLYPDFFSAAVPMSCCPPGSNANNFKTTPVWALSGNSGSNESSYNRCMTNFVNQINNAGGNAKMVTHPGESHDTIANKFQDKEIFNWALSQTKQR